MKTKHSRIVSILLIVILSVTILAACDEDVPRVEPVVTYNPGAPFSTNFNHEDPRRQIKCSVVFEIVDEDAALELEAINYRIRNAVLSVLSELTMEELTTNRNQDAIAARIVDRVNADVGATIGGSRSDDFINLIIRAYFTEFAVI